jgi:hypothetical protein
MGVTLVIVVEVVAGVGVVVVVGGSGDHRLRFFLLVICGGLDGRGG